MKRFILPAATLFALAAAPAAAQDPFEQQVRTMLVEAGKHLEGKGLALTHQIQTGSLEEGQKQTIRFTLDIGREYAILGVCDEDCTDVDLTLFDPAGKQVSIDVTEDDIPVVSATPGRTGQYRVEVTMATCSAEPCRYGVGVFAR